MEKPILLSAALNFLVDFLLLLGASRFLEMPPCPGRCALGAVIGAWAAELPGPWRWVLLPTQGAAAYGLSREGVWRTGLYLLLHLAVQGLAALLAREDAAALALAGGVLWALHWAAGRSEGRDYIPVTLRLGERQVQVLALRDTGNTLRDPVSGDPVLVVPGGVGERLTGLSARQLGDPLGTLPRRPIPGLRLIPYRAVGNAGGILLGVRAEAKIGGRKRSVVAAFDTRGLGEDTPALIGGNV